MYVYITYLHTSRKKCSFENWIFKEKKSGDLKKSNGLYYTITITMAPQFNLGTIQRLRYISRSISQCVNLNSVPTMCLLKTNGQTF